MGNWGKNYNWGMAPGAPNSLAKSTARVPEDAKGPHAKDGAMDGGDMDFDPAMFEGKSEEEIEEFFMMMFMEEFAKGVKEEMDKEGMSEDDQKAFFDEMDKEMAKEMGKEHEHDDEHDDEEGEGKGPKKGKKGGK